MGGGVRVFTCILSPTEETNTLAPYLRRKSIAPSKSRTRHTSLCLTLRACSSEESTLLTSCLGAGRISSLANTSVAHSSCSKIREDRKKEKEGRGKKRKKSTRHVVDSDTPVLQEEAMQRVLGTRGRVHEIMTMRCSRQSRVWLSRGLRVQRRNKGYYS